MYKLIAIDLDGTMLDQFGNLTEKTKQEIANTQQRGIEIVIASGRPIDSIKTIAQEINCKKYFISGNGAIVYDIQKNQIIYENTLKKNVTLEIIKICEENSIYYNIYTEKEIIAPSLQFNVLYYHKENSNKAEKDKTHINIMENIYKYIQEKNEKILKITICDKNRPIFNSIMRKLKEINEIEVLEVAHMSKKIIRKGTEEVPIEYFYTEITAQNVDKWNALEVLKERMGISSEEIIAIGDNVNDKKMIKNAGLGVAMGESTPEIKMIADKITDSNSEDGVANFLQILFRK